MSDSVRRLETLHQAITKAEHDRAIAERDDLERRLNVAVQVAEATITGLAAERDEALAGAERLYAALLSAENELTAALARAENAEAERDSVTRLLHQSQRHA